MSFKGYKTIIFNAVAAVPVLLDGLVQVIGLIEGNPEIKGMLPDGWLGAYAFVVAVGNLWLRMKTDTPVFQKTPTPTAAVVVMKDGAPPVVESVSVVVEKGTAPPSAETVIAAVQDDGVAG